MTQTIQITGFCQKSPIFAYCKQRQNVTLQHFRFVQFCEQNIFSFSYLSFLSTIKHLQNNDYKIHCFSGNGVQCFTVHHPRPLIPNITTVDVTLK